MSKTFLMSAEQTEMIRKIGEVDEASERLVNGVRQKTNYEVLNDKKIDILLERITSLEACLKKTEKLEKDIDIMTICFEQRIDDLEQTVVQQKTIIDYLREDALKSKDFQTTTHSCLNTLFRTVGQIERKQEIANERVAKLQLGITDCQNIQSTNSANIDGLFRVNGKRSEKYQKFKEKADALFAEHAEDIIRLQSTLATYKQENTMLENRFHDLNVMNQSLENSLDVFRLKLVDISDETEKKTSETAEIKKIATQVLYKNREYEQVFAMILGRINHIEGLKQTECSDSQRTCIFCDEMAEMKHDEYDCCINCHVSMTLP